MMFGAYPASSLSPLPSCAAHVLPPPRSPPSSFVNRALPRSRAVDSPLRPPPCLCALPRRALSTMGAHEVQCAPSHSRSPLPHCARVPEDAGGMHPPLWPAALPFAHMPGAYPAVPSPLLLRSPLGLQVGPLSIRGQPCLPRPPLPCARMRGCTRVDAPPAPPPLFPHAASPCERAGNADRGPHPRLRARGEPQEGAHAHAPACHVALSLRRCVPLLSVRPPVLLCPPLHPHALLAMCGKWGAHAPLISAPPHAPCKQMESVRRGGKGEGAKAASASPLCRVAHSPPPVYVSIPGRGARVRGGVHHLLYTPLCANWWGVPHPSRDRFRETVAQQVWQRKKGPHANGRVRAPVDSVPPYSAPSGCM